MRGRPCIPERDGTMIRLSRIVKTRQEIRFMIPLLEENGIKWEFRYHRWTTKRDAVSRQQHRGWALWREE